MMKVLIGSVAVAAALSLSACTTFGEHASPAASPAAQTDLSDPGAENSTPSVLEMRAHLMHDSAFPAGSRNSSPD